MPDHKCYYTNQIEQCPNDAEVEQLRAENERLRALLAERDNVAVQVTRLSERLSNENERLRKGREDLIEAATVIRVTKDRMQEALRKIEYGYSTKLSAAEMASIARQALSV